MAEDYIEVSFRTVAASGEGVDSGEILALLQGGEELGCWEDAGVAHIFWRESRWSPEALADLRRALAAFAIDADAAGIAVANVPDKDWNATWAASLTPVRLGRRIRIRQSWHPPDAADGDIELVIDPRRAFGTGYHATTQLVAEWLEGGLRGGERVLDVGTGSGILSMVALRLGASSALGIDNDPVAVECAREYARANGFGAELELRVGSFDGGGMGTFDVVVANIDGMTLPRLCPGLPRLLKPDGAACLSGLQEHDLPEIAAALAGVGLSVRARFQREEWLALEVGRAPSRRGGACGD
ncbi:MAG: 50S ribosomal protein L11 methyltransferase [Acidobacteriota bacterium]|jgi:ribosomal protein L11 methyltransferase|nr:50S ribosomal protein L11 methyltransferase [Acidobacteriota bacterium]